MSIYNRTQTLKNGTKKLRAESAAAVAATKHPQRKEISLPGELIKEYTVHRKALGLSEVHYLNAAVKTYYTALLTQGPSTIGLVEPGEKCASCGEAPRKITHPNAPPIQAGRGKVRTRIGVRFGDAEASMMLTLADDWFNGVWSWVLEAAIRHFLK